MIVSIVLKIPNDLILPCMEIFLFSSTAGCRAIGEEMVPGASDSEPCACKIVSSLR